MEVVKQVYAAVAAYDLETLKGLLHPELVVVEAAGLPYAGRYEGPDGFVHLLKVLNEAWDQFHCSDFEYLYGEDSVMAVFRFQAISRRTDKKIDMRIAELWRVRDGKVSFLEPFYFDTHHTCGVLGTLEAA